MADNTEVTKGSGVVVAADEPAAGAAAGAKVQRVKPMVGPDGEATDVSTANPMPVSDAGSSLTVDGTVAVSGEPTVKVNSALPAGANNIGDVDVLTLPELPAGTKAIGQTDPRGNVAHDSVDAGNPIKVGSRARTALPTAVSQDDRTDNVSDKFGRLLTVTAPPDQRTNGTTNFTTTTAADVIAAPGASIAIVVTAIKVVNGHATVGTKVEILNDATKVDLGYAGALGGGWTVEDPNGLFVVTANKAVRAKCITTGSDVDVTVYGYKIPA